jgi:hypothetical protein
LGLIKNKSKEQSDGLFGMFVILVALTFAFALGMKWALLTEPKDYSPTTIEVQKP